PSCSVTWPGPSRSVPRCEDRTASTTPSTANRTAGAVSSSEPQASRSVSSAASCGAPTTIPMRMSFLLLFPAQPRRATVEQPRDDVVQRELEILGEAVVGGVEADGGVGVLGQAGVGPPNGCG